MDIYLGIVVRGAPIRDAGELVCLDWESKHIKHRVPIYPDNPSLEHDPNPRGNTRGCRGLLITDKHVVAANYHTLQVFDHQLNHKRDISHGLMVGHHEVFGNGDGTVWVTSTAIDAALRFHVDSGALLEGLWPCEMTPFQSALNITPMSLDKKEDHRQSFLSDDHMKQHSHLHLNAVSVWKGCVYALFNRFGMVANLSTGTVVIEDKTLIGAHNLLITEEGIAVINDTRAATIRLYDLASGKQIQSVELGKFGWVRNMTRWMTASYRINQALVKLKLRPDSIMARPRFARGLDLVGDYLYAGLSPASVLCVEWRTGRLVDAYNYSKDVRVCVHGLRLRR